MSTGGLGSGEYYGGDDGGSPGGGGLGGFGGLGGGGGLGGLGPLLGNTMHPSGHFGLWPSCGCGSIIMILAVMLFICGGCIKVVGQ
jgi:hypothetical protein